MALFKLIDKKLRVILFAYKYIIKCEIITDFFIWHMAKYGRMKTVSGYSSKIIIWNLSFKKKIECPPLVPTGNMQLSHPQDRTQSPVVSYQQMILSWISVQTIEIF